MASILKIIATPTNYLRIKQPQKKWFDIILPLSISAIITALLYLFGLNKISFSAPDGVIHLVNNLMQILSGFYLASMAAVSTFGNPDMDKVMNGEPPIFDKKQLTKRSFLTYLFGYLFFASIALYFLGGVTIYLSAKIIITNYLFYVISKGVVLFVYLATLFNILLTTSLGLYFMIDKINKSETKLIKRELDVSKLKKP